MRSMSPKVIAGSGAAGSSMPLAIILIWILGLLNITVPPEVAAAIASEMAAIAALVAGYYVPHPQPGAEIIAMIDAAIERARAAGPVAGLAHQS